MTYMPPMLSTLSYAGKKKEKKKRIRIVFSLITLLCPAVDFTCSILASPHLLPPSPTAPWLRHIAACKPAGHPHTWFIAGASELSHVPLPQPRIRAAPLSAKQHLSPISKLCSALPSSRKPVSKICGALTNLEGGVKRLGHTLKKT